MRGISKEQVCVLVARDRQKATYSRVICQVRIVKTELEKAIGSKLSISNVLSTDAWRAFMTFAKKKVSSITGLNLMVKNVLKEFIIIKM